MSPTSRLRTLQGPIGHVSSTQTRPFQLVQDSDENLVTRYSLVCHETKTKVVVGANGWSRTAMLSALGTVDAREALCAFFMYNLAHPLALLVENCAEERSFPLYHEFSDGLNEVST